MTMHSANEPLATDQHYLHLLKKTGAQRKRTLVLQIKQPLLPEASEGGDACPRAYQNAWHPHIFGHAERGSPGMHKRTRNGNLK